MSPVRSKKSVLIASCLGLGVLLVLVPLAPNVATAIVILCLALGLVAAIQSQSWALTSDIVPDSHAAQFGGIMNFGGYFGGALAPVITGVVYDHTGSYTPSFILAGVIAALGAVFYGFLVHRPIAGGAQVEADA
jgi:MFS family permease